MAVGLTHYLIVAAILFTLGIAGIILNRKNIIIILMSVELILLGRERQSGRLLGLPRRSDGSGLRASRLLTVAAAESAIGLAILVVFYRNKGTIAVEDINTMKG